MLNLKIARKILAYISCTALSIGIIASYPAFTDNSGKAEAAKTIAEIEEQRKANSEKINALEQQINALEGDKNYEEQQQAYLSEQIGIIQENINLLNAELESIGNDISTTEINIENLDRDIVQQQTDIDNNIELFKQRLCAMYVSGNDTSASIILGSSSFYDMMSRVQMINRIAEYDDKLINNILDEIDRLEESKSNLESEKLNLTMKLEDQEKRKEEKTAEIDQLNLKMQDTLYEIERIANEQASYEREKEDIEKEQQELQNEYDAIKAEEARQAEEARRRWEEQQKLLQQQQQQQQPSNNGGGATVVPPASDPSYVPVTPAASGFAWPCPGYSYISSPFAWRWGRNHNGIDVGDGNIMGGSAVASQAGTVITVNNSCTHNYAKNSSCGCGGGFGNYVVISHDGTYSTLYGHLSYATVSVGEYVKQGQVIGAMGSTGFSTGAHLHFEIRVNGTPQDPLNYVSP